MEVGAMRWDVLMLGVTAALLLAADVLAFHDLFEPHTIRDWLVLVATLIVIAYGLRVAGTPSRSKG
jgi:hypothetical protein